MVVERIERAQSESPCGVVARPLVALGEHVHSELKPKAARNGVYFECRSSAMMAAS